MKIVSLNIWGGKAGREGLLQFFRDHQDVDIFCLQEVWSAPYKNLEGRLAGGVPLNNEKTMVYALREISNEIPEHRAYFRPHFMDNYGLCMFVRKTLVVTEEGEIYVHKEKGYIPPLDTDIGTHARNIQYVKIIHNEKPITIINFHGLWNGQGKGDSEDRIAQSSKILKFIESCNSELILCGDFNLLPETESLQVFEKIGLRNLIAEYTITSTRTSYYEKPVKYASYAFITPQIEVVSFKILPEEVSDHAPLYLEIA